MLPVFVLVIGTVPPLHAELASAPDSEAETVSWENLAGEHQQELLVGAAILLGIVLLSATILAILVRHLKRKRESNSLPVRTEPASAGRPGVQRGARAFPKPGAGGFEKPAASGDTTRLTPEVRSSSAERRNNQVEPHGLQGRELMIVLAAWGCLIAGVGIMVRNADNYAVCVPVLLMAFLLAVMAMAQRLVLHGSLILVALYVAAPTVWMVHRLGPKAPEQSIVLHTPMSLPAQNVPSAVSTDAKSPETPMLLLPEDDALPPSTAAVAAPRSSATPAPKLPPPPVKAANSLLAYRARLSRADHLNQDGVDLRTLARTKFNDILVQERLHVHQHARRDPEDTVDEAFGTGPVEEYRTLLEGKPIRMPSSVSLIHLLKDDIIVDVQVFEQFVQVDPVTPLAHH